MIAPAIHNVVITGAARGMGALYAHKAVAQGARKLVLWDVDAAQAQQLKTNLSKQGLEILVVSENLAQYDAIQAGVAQIKAFMGAPDVLVNNAGIVCGKPFWEHDSEQDITRTININTLAPMWLTRAFIQDMMADKSVRKRILNIASAAGTLPNPNMSVYAASKWALIGWSESLRLECQYLGYEHITVTTFCPSYVSTGMFDGAKAPFLTPILSPQQAADAAWEGMLKGTPIVNKPWTVKFAMALRGLLPTRWFDVLAKEVFKVYSSMSQFKGR